MRAVVLGSAAGGGFPQWNCACRNCRGLRDGSLKASPRTQTSVAIALDDGRWALLDCSPDVLRQIADNPFLQPGEGRDSPISDIVLTGADLDQVLGLFNLRESGRFRVHCTPFVRKVLERNVFLNALRQTPEQTIWSDIEGDFSLSGLPVRVLKLPGHFPHYIADRSGLEESESCIALRIGGLVYAPRVGGVTAEFLDFCSSADTLLFDGSFATDEELLSMRPDAPGAWEMGHMPMFGPGGSLEALSEVDCKRKVYLHLNNTNPVLDEESEERHLLEAEGWEIGLDGLSLP